jgi:hypothetical protein
VNEVADSGAGSDSCDGEDYVELKNIGPDTVDPSGYMLTDEKGPTDGDAYKFPAESASIDVGAILLLCKDAVGSFAFGIGGSDTVTLYDAASVEVSTTGELLGFGSTSASYQRLSDGSGYLYAIPTPGEENAFQADNKVVVNEVADKGAGSDVCNGEDYIELKNLGPNPAVLDNFVLSDDGGFARGYTITDTSIGAEDIILFCKVKTFLFGIGGTDTVTLFDQSGVALSTTGTLTGAGSETSSIQRKPDDTYEYSLPTPGKPNVFFSPLVNTVVVNEVGDKGAFNTCDGDGVTGGADYVELLNLSSDPVDISGFILSDDKGPGDGDALVFPTTTVIGVGEFLVLCRKDAEGSFAFGIGGDDTVTLFDTNSDLVSTSGVLQNLGSPSLSFQRKVDGSYDYADSSPGKANVFPPPIIVVNEVAPTGGGGVCNGGNWVELLNEGLDTVVGGYVLTNGSGTYTIPADTTIDTRGYLLVCVTEFDIGATDTISLLDDINGEEVSSSGQIGGGDSPPDGNFVWARKVDLMSVGEPNDPVFVYTPDATPEAANIFTFEVTNVPMQECGQVTEPYGKVSDYEHLATFEVGVNPEFSGGSFYGGTCTHWIFGDEGFATEFNLADLPTVEELRRIRLVGGSGDTEGSCFYTEKINDVSVTKIAYVDERERSVALCDIPTANQDGIIYRDSSNCLVIGLTTEQSEDSTLTSAEPNEGFEGVGKYMNV